MRKNITIIITAILCCVASFFAFTFFFQKKKAETVIVEKKKDSTALVAAIKKDVKQTLEAYKSGGYDSVLKSEGISLPPFDSTAGRPVALSVAKMDTVADYIRSLKNENDALRIALKKKDTVINIMMARNQHNLTKTKTVIKTDTVNKVKFIDVPFVKEYIAGDRFYKTGDLKQYLTIAPIVRYNITTNNFTPGFSFMYRNGRFSSGVSGLFSQNTGRLFYTGDLTFDLIRYPISRKK